MRILKKNILFRYFFNKIYGAIHGLKIFGTAYIGENVKFEGRNLISSDCELIKCKFGYSSYVGKNVQLTNTKVGRYTSIGPNVCNVVGRHPTRTFVSTHPAFFSVAKQVGYTYADQQLFDECKYTSSEGFSAEIGNDVWIGANSIILDGITIADGAIIGAGCVVSRSVGPYEICVGNPQRILRKRFNDYEIEMLLRIKWWDKDPSWLKQNVGLFSDVERFLNELSS